VYLKYRGGPRENSIDSRCPRIESNDFFGGILDGLRLFRGVKNDFISLRVLDVFVRK
jgi:hypothetical protein